MHLNPIFKNNLDNLDMWSLWRMEENKFQE